MPTTTQLRRYELKPDLVDAFVEWFPSRLIPAREAHGFTLEFALLNREKAEFTWAVSVEGDEAEFARIEAAYAASAERAAAFAGIDGWTNASHITLVEKIG